MRWLTNLYDPRLPDALVHVLPRPGETQLEAWQRQQEWLVDKIIADPKSTSTVSMEQMKQWHLVGIYVED